MPARPRRLIVPIDLQLKLGVKWSIVVAHEWDHRRGAEIRHADLRHQPGGHVQEIEAVA